MQQLSEFVINHWMLVTAFCVVAGLLLANLMSAAGGVSPEAAVMLINREQAVVVDVRADKAFASGHITGALHVPQASLADARSRLEAYKDRPVLVCCDTGATAGGVVRQLRGWGIERAQALNGGITAWRGANLPLESS
ncbi:MAG: rhodanese-like domain-containing protein [Gammaproteobacteria bacterium]|nr:rhodanese-like domain-containing protein [Gammaproteobacteria bacterium]MCP5199310.1 rhodanese-like domain-containing protein [Gammaproteobacteria bacterium]